MDRRQFLEFIGWTAAGLGLGSGSSWGSDRTMPALPRRGVSLAGAEFGADGPGFSNRSPGRLGRDYTYNSERTVAYFCEQGLSLLRLPLRWERLQPRLGEALDEDEVGRLAEFVGWAKKHGGQVVLDVHNYGRYVLQHKGKNVACVIDEVTDGATLVSRDHFADLWRRLAKRFRDEPAVCAFGLMNEPHDLGKSDWKVISQAAVDAVRGEGDKRLILVAGDDWSSAHTFARANGLRAWIKDPADRVAYEGHCYFDHDNSGRYKKSYADELAQDRHLEWRGAERLLAFVGWCRLNGVKGFVGEFGIPADETGWQKVLARMLEAMDRAEMSGCYWAAGEWWHGDRLSVQPGDDIRKPAPQLGVLKR
jgi:endoglucanase